MSVPNLDPGTRYTKNGFSVDIHKVQDGEVYCRRWLTEDLPNPSRQDLLRIPLSDFIADAQDAEVEMPDYK